MPELPDVETFRKRLARTVLHKRIKSVKIKNSRVVKASRKKLKAMEGRSFEKAERHGKHCFLKLSSGNHLAMHFGMTGDVRYYKDGAKPDNAPLVIRFSDRHSFAFINVRKLGKLRLIKDKEKFIEKQKLGPDALAMTKKSFVKLMQNKKGRVKTALMDQKTLAGIGNIYADEILYQAGIRPQKRLGRLEKKDLERIHKVMKRVLKTAIRNKGEADRMPASYLLGRRKDGTPCGRCSGTIKKTQVNSRSTYHCPKHQR